MQNERNMTRQPEGTFGYQVVITKPSVMMLTCKGLKRQRMHLAMKVR